MICQTYESVVESVVESVLREKLSIVNRFCASKLSFHYKRAIFQKFFTALSLFIIFVFVFQWRD